MASKPEAEAMQELASMLWSRFLKERVREELNHELNAYKAEVVTNNGNGTLTVRRPFESVTLTLKAAPSLAYAQPGDMVMVAGIGDKSKALSNAFVLAKADLSDDTSLPVYGQGENLLDNWYFVGGGSQQGGGQFPINQRGQTSYTATGNGLDRWRLHIYNSTALVKLKSDGLELSGQDAAILQIIKYPASELLGKAVTLSILVDGALYSATAEFPSTYSATSNVILQAYSGWGYGLLSRPAPVGAANAYYVAIGTSSAAAKKITAVKLELGTQQTLAHQENGAWVLNELPDYTEEWAKCNRYLRVYGRKSTHGLSRMTGPQFSNESRSGYVQCALAFDTPMADVPTVSDNGALAVRNITSGGNVADVTFSFPAPSRGSINIKAESANITAGTLYYVDTLISEGQLIISAEL